MTQIILVTIGIILAAAAALMTVYYGGDALSAGHVRARAATLENAGLNVEAAVLARRLGNRDAVNTIDDLSGGAGGSWLTRFQLGDAATGTPAIVRRNGWKLFEIEGVSPDTCARVNADYARPAGEPVSPNLVVRGCTTAPPHRYFVILPNDDGSTGRQARQIWRATDDYKDPTDFDYTGVGAPMVFDGQMWRVPGYSFWLQGSFVGGAGGDFIMHPGPQPGNGTQIRFRVPRDGEYFMVGSVSGGNQCGDGVRAVLRAGNQVLIDGHVFRNELPFDVSRPLLANQYISLEIYPLNEDSCDGTNPRLQIGRY